MSERQKRYDYLSFGRVGDQIFADVIGFVSTRNIRSAKNGAVRSFGIPLENVQGTVAAMFPNDFSKENLPETVWVNTAFFDNERFKLAQRFSKAIEGKERIRIRVSGIARVNEFKGNKSVELIANDFHILWADSYKGTNIGGGPDGYSYVSGIPFGDQNGGQLAIQGFVSRPELRETKGGRKVLNFGVALNRANSKIKYVTGYTSQDDTIWVDVAIFDNDYFPQAQNAAKVIRSGAAIAGLGKVVVDNYNGKERLSMVLNDFEMLRFANDHTSEMTQTNQTTQPDQTTQDGEKDLFAELLDDVFIDTNSTFDEDDLPF